MFQGQGIIKATKISTDSKILMIRVENKHLLIVKWASSLADKDLTL